MQDQTPSDVSGGFSAPKKSLRALKPEIAAFAIAACADVALVISAKGVIEDASFTTSLHAEMAASSFIGQPWAETVTEECVDKVKRALDKAKAHAVSDWHEINHPTGGDDAPLRYIVVRIDGEKSHKFLAMGRSQRRTAALQRRLVFAQQEMEREYAKVRDAEARYRMLFQHTSEAVLVVDSATQRVQEINPAAVRLIKTDADRVMNKPVSQLFPARVSNDLATLFAMARTTGSADIKSLPLSKGGLAVDAFAAGFNIGRSPKLLLRLVPKGQSGDADSGLESELSAMLAASPEGIVITDLSGMIRSVNAAFLEMLQAPTADAVEGQRLDRWLGRPGATFAALESRVQQDGTVRFFETQLEGQQGVTLDVDVSGVVVADTEPGGMAFIVRDLGARLAADVSVRSALPEAVEQMRELVGRVPLKELVRETTDIIEKMCIQAALEITNDNRASAAELLGLSRQSLYVKLRRYGLDAAASN
ncbi:MAG: transcriptional regulator PpsR [Pseudomonadota bacterium]